MLDKINLKDEDTLHISGDVIDRVRNGIKILSDIMKRGNVDFIMGNHEAMMLFCLPYLINNPKNIPIETTDFDHIEDFLSWLDNKCQPTLNGLCEIAKVEIIAIYKYLKIPIIIKKLKPAAIRIF